MEQAIYDQYQAQSALEQQKSSNEMSKYAPTLHDQAVQNQAVLVEQTNPKKVIYEIELSLKNMEQLPDGSTVKIGEPIMNDKGVNRMKFIMRSVINQNTILSHLDEKQISKLAIGLSEDIIDDLALNWKEYGITDKIMLDHIVDAITIPAFLALQRALEQNEKNWLGKITLENLSGGQRMPLQKKEGWFSKFRL